MRAAGRWALPLSFGGIRLPSGILQTHVPRCEGHGAPGLFGVWGGHLSGTGAGLRGMG